MQYIAVFILDRAWRIAGYRPPHTGTGLSGNYPPPPEKCTVLGQYHNRRQILQPQEIPGVLLCAQLALAGMMNDDAVHQFTPSPHLSD